MQFILGFILQEYWQDLEINPSPTTRKEALKNVNNLISAINSREIQCLFTSEELYTATNDSFIFAQLNYIFTFLRQEKCMKKSIMSTKPSSKCLEYSFSNDSPINLEHMEEKVTKEERRLMYISDLRTNCENYRLVSVPSIREIPHSSSQRVLSQDEVLICFLLTPRIVQIAHNNRLLRVLVNVLPDEMRFSLKNEKYIFECKEIGNMTTIFLCEIEEIERIECKAPTLELWVNKQPLKIVCKSIQECEKYFNGLQYLLKRV